MGFATLRHYRWMEKSKGRRVVNQCILDPDELGGIREMFDQLDLDGGELVTMTQEKTLIPLKAFAPRT